MFEHQMIDVDIKVDACCLLSGRSGKSVLNVTDFANRCVVHTMVPYEDGTSKSLFHFKVNLVYGGTSCGAYVLGNDTDRLIANDISTKFALNVVRLSSVYNASGLGKEWAK